MPTAERTAAERARRADAPAAAPFKKRSLAGTLAAAHSAVGSSDPIKVTGDVTADRAPGAADLAYSGRLRIPRAKSRGLIVGYEYSLAVAGDDVTAPLEIAVKFVGTPDGSNPDVVAVDFVGRDAVRELAHA